MSLFRTLQNSPATISIFHNKKIASSSHLYKVLNRAYENLNKEKFYFQLDVMENRMPTFDQYQYIIANTPQSSMNNDVLRACFPLLKDDSSTEETKVETANAISNVKRKQTPSFTEGEYNLFYDTFNKILESNNSDVDSAAIFKPPLVVDWDQVLIANNEEGVSTILSKYGD